MAPEWHWCWVAFLTVWSSVWVWMGLWCLIICLKNRRQSYRKSNETEIFRSLSSFITAAKRFGVKCLELDLFLVLYIMSIFSLSLKQYWILSVFFLLRSVLNWRCKVLPLKSFKLKAVVIQFRRQINSFLYISESEAGDISHACFKTW